MTDRIRTDGVPEGLRGQMGFVCEGDSVAIGFLGEGPASCCPECYERRRVRGRDGERSAGHTCVPACDVLHGTARTLLPRLAERVATALARGLIVRARAGRADLAVEYALPLSTCERCAKHDDGSPRLLAPAAGPLREDYVRSLLRVVVSENVGLVSTIEGERWGPGYRCVATLSGGRDDGMNGAGVGHEGWAAAGTAALEVLERISCVHPARNDSLTHLDVGDERMADPRAFGVYDSYGEPDGTACVAPTAGTRVWVAEATEIGTGRSVHVPASLVYYGDPRADTGQGRLFVESSNGMSVGLDLEDAMHRGLAEVYERDAVLKSWYSGRAPERLDPARWLSRDEWSHWRALCHDLDADDVVAMRVPGDTPHLDCVLVVGRDGLGRRPNLGGAAGWGVAGALRKAISEFVGVRAGMIAAGDGDRWRDADPVVDVVDVADHGKTHFWNPGLWRLWDFWFDAPPGRSVPGATPAASADRFRLLTEAQRRAGRTVLAVDLTNSTHRAVGLRCAKVLVPGTVPPSFGGRNRRVTAFLEEIRRWTVTNGFEWDDTVVRERALVPHPIA
ncbi:YcaO-like family protein [Myceligenerans salitolerans]|uniref:YcaO-like family protein n=1 Tax=Myceligenerans salitolerans TaxID=1230528 RepID=A0ABS3ICV1_9MICO|nr:YcaO-like family protein [Myceligenerans salitolerans]MBO0610214.1 YcaO-like family protein [Myceligenerans salitolerans]